MNIFIHTNDLRIHDNSTLNIMYKTINEPIIPIYILSSKHSNNYTHFLSESLNELKLEYEKYNSTLHIYFGKINNILEKIHKKINIKNLGFNYNYSKINNTITRFCKNNNINLFNSEDSLLVNIVNNKNYPNKCPYKKFTPFLLYQKSNFKVNKPLTLNIKFTKLNYNIKEEIQKINYNPNPNLHFIPGRKEGIKLLNNISKNYSNNRDCLHLNTSNLSAYINIGLLSIREVYYTSKKKIKNDDYINELYWRDFYYNILHHYPKKSKYDNIKWENNNKNFKLWCNGKTGFPIVDASMRQLNKTGYMHNRGRMIVASFLIKDLFIDWKLGEKYFSKKLVDYNKAANNGGWQWISGTGIDSQPYFHVFNPWRQIEKYDPNCIYIKRWIPELRMIPNYKIKKWYKYYCKDISYPKPIIKHNTKKTIKKYKKYLHIRTNTPE